MLFVPFCARSKSFGAFTCAPGHPLILWVPVWDAHARVSHCQAMGGCADFGWRVDGGVCVWMGGWLAAQLG
eukprot:5600878-Prymnesium_polylepis.2